MSDLNELFESIRLDEINASCRWFRQGSMILSVEKKIHKYIDSDDLAKYFLLKGQVFSMDKYKLSRIRRSTQMFLSCGYKNPQEIGLIKLKTALILSSHVRKKIISRNELRAICSYINMIYLSRPYHSKVLKEIESTEGVRKLLLSIPENNEKIEDHNNRKSSGGWSELGEISRSDRK